MGGSVNGSPATAMEITVADGNIITILFNRNTGDLTVLPEGLASHALGEAEFAVTNWDYQGDELWLPAEDGIAFTPRHIRDTFSGEHLEREDRRNFGIDEMKGKVIETFREFGYQLSF